MTRTPPADPALVPITDEQRTELADLVIAAAGDGVVALPEVDRVLAGVYRAETAGELDAVREQLPAGWLDGHRRGQQALATQRVAQAALRWHVAAYAAGMALMVAIWLAVGLAAGAWYPWPVWPALGWGLGVRSHARAAAGFPGRRCGAARALPRDAVRV